MATNNIDAYPFWPLGILGSVCSSLCTVFGYGFQKLGLRRSSVYLFAKALAWEGGDRFTPTPKICEKFPKLCKLLSKLRFFKRLRQKHFNKIGLFENIGTDFASPRIPTKFRQMFDEKLQN